MIYRRVYGSSQDCLKKLSCEVPLARTTVPEIRAHLYTEIPCNLVPDARRMKPHHVYPVSIGL